MKEVTGGGIAIVIGVEKLLMLCCKMRTKELHNRMGNMSSNDIEDGGVCLIQRRLESVIGVTKFCGIVPQSQWPTNRANLVIRE